MNEPLIFFGTDAFSVPSLVRLLGEGANVVAVVTKPDSPTGRGRQITPPAVKRLAEAQGIPVFQPDKLADLLPIIDRLRPTAGIVVAYGKIIPQSIINLFPAGLINVHASLLPRWRGASPIEHALLAGDPETGVTLMSIEAGLDTGPTYTSAKLQLAGHETRLDLYEQLAELGADLLAADIQPILAGTIAAIPQDSAAATLAGLITKDQGELDFDKDALTLERQIRAFLGWPGSRTVISGTPVTVTAARAIGVSGPSGQFYISPTKELSVYCAEGSLIIDALKPAGKGEMSGSAYLAGHPLPRS